MRSSTRFLSVAVVGAVAVAQAAAQSGSARYGDAARYGQQGSAHGSAIEPNGGGIPARRSTLPAGPDNPLRGEADSAERPTAPPPLPLDGTGGVNGVSGANQATPSGRSFADSLLGASGRPHGRSNVEATTPVATREMDRPGVDAVGGALQSNPLYGRVSAGAEAMGNASSEPARTGGVVLPPGMGTSSDRAVSPAQTPAISREEQLQAYGGTVSPTHTPPSQPVNSAPSRGFNGNTPQRNVVPATGGRRDAFPPADARQPISPSGVNVVSAESTPIHSSTTTSEPGSAKSWLERLIEPPARDYLQGRALSLTEAVQRASGSSAQKDIVVGYWQLVRDVVAYHAALHVRSEWERSSGGGFAERDAVGARIGLEVAKRRLAAVESQFELARTLQLSVNELPLPTSRPHVGSYRTRYEEIFSNHSHTSAARLNQVLPLQHEIVRGQVARLNAIESQGSVEWLEALDAMLETITRYNASIADYALLASGNRIGNGQLVPLLIRKDVERSSRVAERIEQVTGNASRNAQLRQDSTTRMPLAVSDVPANERSVLITRSGNQESGVRPAAAWGLSHTDANDWQSAEAVQETIRR